MTDLKVGVGKFWAQLKGADLIGLLVVFTFTISALTAYLVYADTTKSQYDRDRLAARQEDIKKAIEAAADAQRETTYVLSLPQDKRERLNLQMPDSLRKRIGGM